jgi:acetyl-CoA acyltransferase
MVCNQLNEVYIAAYGRSAIGRARKGALREIHPVDMGGLVLMGSAC